MEPGHGPVRAIRGGFFLYPGSDCRSAFRREWYLNRPSSHVGIRLRVRIPREALLTPEAKVANLKLPPALRSDFDVPLEDRDRHANPIRQGVDRKTGWPLEIRHRKTGMHLVFIPAGKFMMGSPESEKDRHAPRLSEGPVHPVCITRPYYLGKYELTQSAWITVMASNPSRQKHGDNPVENVSWDDCQQFLGKLNEGARSGPLQGAGGGPAEAGYYEHSLPTEAQWEYACRAGTKTRFFYSSDPEAAELDDYCWFRKNSSGRNHPVGQKKPNPWGLYDMYGNVGEWCSDWAGPYAASSMTDPSGPPTGRSRISRGGLRHTDVTFLRSASRYCEPPTLRLPYQGFRVAVMLTH